MNEPTNVAGSPDRVRAVIAVPITVRAHRMVGNLTAAPTDP
jgi:hypothetical protein